MRNSERSRLAGIRGDETRGRHPVLVPDGPTSGSAEEIADGFRAFRAGGFTQLEVILWPPTPAALEAMAPVLEVLDAD